MKLLLKTASLQLRNNEVYREVVELMEKVHNLTQSRFMLKRAMAVATVLVLYRFNTLIMAAVWMAFHCIVDFFTNIIEKTISMRTDRSFTVIGSPLAMQ